jgi:hypothetical protein
VDNFSKWAKIAPSKKGEKPKKVGKEGSKFFRLNHPKKNVFFKIFLKLFLDGGKPLVSLALKGVNNRIRG